MAALNLYLDPTTNDLALTPGLNLRLTQNNAEFVSQKITNRLQLFAGEWFLNREIGVPYFTDVFGKDPDLLKVRSLLIAEITAVDGVQEIIDFSLELSRGARDLRVNFKARITTGEIILGEVNL